MPTWEVSAPLCRLGQRQELHLLCTQDTLIMHWLVLTTTLRARCYHAISLALPKVTSLGGGPRKHWVGVGQEVHCELEAVLGSHWTQGSRQAPLSSCPSWAGGHLGSLTLCPSVCLP